MTTENTLKFKMPEIDDAYVESVNKRNREIEEAQHVEDKKVLVDAICNISFIEPTKEAELKMVQLLDENGIWIKSNLEYLKDETLIKLYLSIKPVIPKVFSIPDKEDTHIPSILSPSSKIEIFQSI